MRKLHRTEDKDEKWKEESKEWEWKKKISKESHLILYFKKDIASRIRGRQ